MPQANYKISSILTRISMKFKNASIPVYCNITHASQKVLKTLPRNDENVHLPKIRTISRILEIIFSKYCGLRLENWVKQRIIVTVGGRIRNFFPI